MPIHKAMNTPNHLDKISGSFLLGACGDALGAPLEAIFNLNDIIQTYGSGGLVDMIPFESAFETGRNFPAGVITDDTTMAMTTAAAVILTCQTAKPNDTQFSEKLRANLWQGYLNWGQHQDDGAPLAHKIDPTLAWPDNTEKFWFYCGAGRGTIAALLQDKPGSLTAPMNYNCRIRDRETKGPNSGCGGMMRVVPIALLPDITAPQIFELGCESAAITHGDPGAYVATGITALYTHFAANNLSMTDIFFETNQLLENYKTNPIYKDGIDDCQTAVALSVMYAEINDHTPLMSVIDMIPKNVAELTAKRVYRNPFLAVPVLAQTAYALACAELNDHTDLAAIKNTMVVSANHSGDSDSVAAIVGNVLGARYGTAAIPTVWLNKLVQKTDITAMADAFYASVHPPALHT